MPIGRFNWEEYRRPHDASGPLPSFYDLAKDAYEGRDQYGFDGWGGRSFGYKKDDKGGDSPSGGSKVPRKPKPKTPAGGLSLTPPYERVK